MPARRYDCRPWRRPDSDERRPSSARSRKWRGSVSRRRAGLWVVHELPRSTQTKQDAQTHSLADGKRLRCNAVRGRAWPRPSLVPCCAELLRGLEVVVESEWDAQEEATQIKQGNASQTRDASASHGVYSPPAATRAARPRSTQKSLQVRGGSTSLSAPQSPLKPSQIGENILLIDLSDGQELSSPARPARP